MYPGKLSCPTCHKNKIAIVLSDPQQTKKILEQSDKIILAGASKEQANVQWLCKDCNATGQVKYKSELFYELQHDSYGCMNPRCRFVYTEAETETAEFAEYIKNHTYAESPPKLFKLEAKIWTLDDVVNLEPIYGWTPKFDLDDNGFELVKDIDLFEALDIDHTKLVAKRQGVHIDLTLPEYRQKLKKILYEIDFENHSLLIFRTQRQGMIPWNAFDVFAIGQYHVKKDEIRKKVTKDCKEYQKKEEIEIKKREAYNKAHGIVIPDWDAAKKRLDKFLKEKNPKNYLFDPTADKGYDMDSVEDRKRLYRDVTKRRRKNC